MAVTEDDTVTAIISDVAWALQAAAQLALIVDAFRKEGKYPEGRFDLGHITIQAPILIAGNLCKNANFRHTLWCMML